MQIKFLEIQNFRKLKSVHIELSEKTTLFVGANNSGKTSAMVALGYFLVDSKRFSINDFTLSNWTVINKIGNAWEKSSTPSDSQANSLIEWEDVLPTLDVWLKIEKTEVHHICHIIPTLSWCIDDFLGVRLRLEPKNIEELRKEYIAARKAANVTVEEANKEKKEKCTLSLWPESMRDFLEKRLGSQFDVHFYLLDPKKLSEPKKGIAQPQRLAETSECIDENPFKGLIRIDEIRAQRGFSDTGDNSAGTDGDSILEHTSKRSLSAQLRSYYDKHIDPREIVETSDVVALEAIQKAQDEFDKRLEEGFKEALQEVESLGYPGVTDPKLIISTKISPIDGFKHSSALQYEVNSPKNEDSSLAPRRLPEQYNGLGYQNLISMVFRLMSFRDAWMKVGKEGKRAAAKASENSFFPPLHLVLIEEPEAHLHAQVQQVFIRKAYNILRKHSHLGDSKTLSTQLVVSTHSSHIAYECDFDHLRYFRRLPAVNQGDVPISIVVNLSTVFGDQGNETQKFVTRYLRTTHCDLFFADAAILVEGAAERMLIPHFIREHFKKLSQSYLTLLEIGGRHAHRLRPLIEHLGLTTLVITDLDSAESTGYHLAKHPARGENLITGNTTLKEWLPGKELIDELLDVSVSDKIKKHDDFSSVRVAYQSPVLIQIDASKDPEETLSNTFEEALVFENILIFKTLSGEGMIKKFRDAINKHKTSASLGQGMFEFLKDGKKAEFALELLFSQEPNVLKVPTYIDEGLTWLQEQLERKQLEVLTSGEIKDSPKEVVA
jgi:predicted ATP-dependent endonuclease of OLD family